MRRGKESGLPLLRDTGLPACRLRRAADQPLNRSGAGRPRLHERPWVRSAWRSCLAFVDRAGGARNADTTPCPRSMPRLSAQRSEARANLLGQELRLFPGCEMAADV